MLKTGVENLYLLFHGLMIPNNGTMVAFENSNRAFEIGMMGGVGQLERPFFIIFVTQKQYE